MFTNCGAKSDHGDPWTLVAVGRHSAEPPQDWYIVLFLHMSEEDSPLRHRDTARAKGMSAVKLLPRGWVTQVEYQGNYQLGNSADKPELLLSESAREHEKNLQESFDAFATSLAEDDSSEVSEVFGSPIGGVQKGSDHSLDQDSI